MPPCLGGGEYETNPVKAGPIAPWRFESSLHSSLNNKPSRVASALRLAAFFLSAVVLTKRFFIFQQNRAQVCATPARFCPEISADRDANNCRLEGLSQSRSFLIL